MNAIESIILGAVQGLTEFIPVSSSGHLVIFQYIFSGSSEHLFLEFINIGTLAALMVYFRKRIYKIFKETIEQKNYTVLRNIIITSIPAGLIGFFASDYIASELFFNSIYTVIATLIVVGFIMIFINRIAKKQVEELSIETLHWHQALFIGLAQMTALIPGVSRSGSTIIMGRLVGMTPKSAAEYSFIASLPIMIAVTIKIFIKATDRQYFFDNLEFLVVGNIVAFVAGILAIGFLMRYLERHSLAIFGWYRVALAFSILAFILLQ